MHELMPNEFPSSKTMIVIPAIDLRDGRVVRLRQGDYARETNYDIAPQALAENYAQAGACWLHMVDLDGARVGSFANLAVIAAIAANNRLRVQAGGGVRTIDDVQRLFDHGVARVVLGSVAVRDPQSVLEWIARFGTEKICVALDTRKNNGSWELPVSGWTESASATLDELAPLYAANGARHLLCTDIARDGMLSGPNLDLYRHLQTIAPMLEVQASGGVRDLLDVQALRVSGVSGAILGRSLLEGKLDLREALTC
jgi:phosphoribosylformimino-5-aminoimidazole carboxamide ribotide isomerase